MADGELAQSVSEPPPYDGNYSEEVLNPLKHVRMTLLGSTLLLPQNYSLSLRKLWILSLKYTPC